MESDSRSDPAVGIHGDTLIASTAALYSPVALTLATLSGQVVYGNVRAMQLFGSSSATEFRARSFNDFCFAPELMAEIEAVARDGRERQFRLRREVEPVGRRNYLCRISRVAERAGIPAWIAFVAQELEYVADGDVGLTEASILETYRTLSGSAAWSMVIEHPVREWCKNSIRCSRERFALFGARRATATPTAQTFLDLVHVADRATVCHAVETSLETQAPLEIVYRLAPRLGQSKILLTRGMVIDDDAGPAGSRSLRGVDIDLSAAIAENRIPFEKSGVLDSLAAHLEGPLYAVDAQFRYIYFNDTFARHMRELYEAETTLRCKAYDAAPASERRRIVQANFRRALSGTPVVEKLSITLKDSGVTTYELTYAPIIVASQTHGVVVFGIRVS